MEVILGRVIRSSFTAMANGINAQCISCAVLIVILSVVAISAEDKSPEVCARSGCVTGVSHDVGAGRSYEAFLGLPYARPPTKRYRFQVTYRLIP